MSKRYAKDFRRGVCARLVGGEKVRSLSEELGVSEATLYPVIEDARVDEAQRPGHDEDDQAQDQLFHLVRSPRFLREPRCKRPIQ
jgi:transposase-like protein